MLKGMNRINEYFPLSREQYIATLVAKAPIPRRSSELPSVSATPVEGLLA